LSDEAAPRLVAECRRLALSLFGIDPPATLVASYQRAVLQSVAGTGAAADEERVAAAVRRGADLEALEFAWRRRDPKNLLSRKAHLLAFLLETDPRSVHRFVLERPQRLRAPLALAAALARAPWKAWKGRRLLRRLPGGGGDG
jgi:hypothetical protein